MERMPIEDAEQVECLLPEFVDLVQGTEGDGVKMRIEDFEGQPVLFYNCVRYALTCGRYIQLQPKERLQRR